MSTDFVAPDELPKIATLAEFVELCITTASEQPGRFFFRGHRRHHYDLIPRLHRLQSDSPLWDVYNSRDPMGVQTQLILRLIRYAERYRPDLASAVPPDDFLSWLCLAQHHGLPTFLLDWSLNPLVALYFATCFDTEASKYDGAIWMMEIESKANRDPKTIVHVESNVISPVPLERSAKKALEAEQETRKNISNDGYIDFPVIVAPRILTRRIDAQAARFSYWSQPGSMDLYTASPGLPCPWRAIRKFCIIPSAAKAKLAKDLIMFRIHHGSIYSDLDGYARFLEEGGL